jgi:hypothetical protein
MAFSQMFLQSLVVDLNDWDSPILAWFCPPSLLIHHLLQVRSLSAQPCSSRGCYLVDLTYGRLLQHRARLHGEVGSFLLSRTGCNPNFACPARSQVMVTPSVSGPHLESHCSTLIVLTLMCTTWKPRVNNLESSDLDFQPSPCLTSMI